MSFHAHSEPFDCGAFRTMLQLLQLPQRSFRELVMKPFTLTAVVLFLLIALVHLFRLFTGWDVVITGFRVPVWWSAPILVVFAGLAFLVWREKDI